MEREELRQLRLGCLHTLAEGPRECTKAGLHELSFILQEGMGLPTRYTFRNLHGPRSDELDSRMSELKFTGFLEIREDPEPGNPQQLVTALEPDADRLAREMLRDMRRAAAPWREITGLGLELFGDRDSVMLHRQAYLLMLHGFQDESPPDMEKTVGMAMAAMPKMDRQKTEADYRELERLGMLDGSARRKSVAEARSASFHLELEDVWDTDRLRDALWAAGIGIRDCRTATGVRDGYAFTHLLIQGIWDQETGCDDCRGECRGQTPRHVPWRDLDEEQRDAFARRYTRFLENCRQDQLQPELLLQDTPEFEDIQLSRHG